MNTPDPGLRTDAAGAAETGTGSPRPSANDSISPGSPALPSHLLATRMTGVDSNSSSSPSALQTW